jgi:hypothetical protein
VIIDFRRSLAYVGVPLVAAFPFTLSLLFPVIQLGRLDSLMH